MARFIIMENVGENLEVGDVVFVLRTEVGI